MKKLLLLAGVVALTCSTQVLAQEGITPEAKGPCPIAKCERRLTPDMGCPDRMRRPHHPPRFDMKKFEDELNLTDKQKEQIKQLKQKEMEAAKPLFEQLKTKEAEAMAIRKQLRDLRIQNKKDFEAILTDKQLKKLEKIKAEHREKFAKRPHRGEFHRRPPMPPVCKCNCGCKELPPQPKAEEK